MNTTTWSFDSSVVRLVTDGFGSTAAISRVRATGAVGAFGTPAGAAEVSDAALGEGLTTVGAGAAGR
jgi:hypothetical protein